MLGGGVSGVGSGKMGGWSKGEVGRGFEDWGWGGGEKEFFFIVWLC